MLKQAYHHNQEQALSGRVKSVNEQSANAVHSTRNYSQFRFSSANRAIKQKHLERLHDAISTKNMLDKYPITVTPGMVVIDGQHRLKVAEALQVPIYYIVASDMAIDDIRMINDVSLKWAMTDYLHYWCEMGNEEYRQIAAFCEKWPEVSVSFAAFYLSPRMKDASWSDVFRSGRTTTKRLGSLKRVLEVAKDFKPYIKNRWANKHFLYAAKTLISTPGYDHGIMLARLEYQSTRLVPCVNTDAYLALLSEIYNHRTRQENRLDFVAQRKLDKIEEAKANFRRSRKADE